MKISVITSYTNPEERMDPWKEALECYENFADEVVVTGQNLKDEFEFSDIGLMFQEGFDKAGGDWVVKMDIDTFLHEKDFNKLYSAMKKFSEYPAISLRKFQFFTPERYHMKSRMAMVVNKKKFKNIKFNGGGDGCDPTLNGILLNEKNVPVSLVPFWNYDSVFKTKEIIAKDRARFARAWKRTYGNYGDRGGPESETAFNSWINMIEERYKKHIFNMPFDNHPSFIKEKLLKLNDHQFGNDLFGIDKSIKRSFKDYLSAINEMYINEVILYLKSSYKKNNFHLKLDHDV